MTSCVDTTPPKEILKSSVPTFIEAGFVPAANIHFSPQEEGGNEYTFLSRKSIDEYGGKLDDAEIRASWARWVGRVTLVAGHVTVM